MARFPWACPWEYVKKNDYDNLCQIGVTLFQDDDFRQTLKADAEVLKFFKADEEDIRLLETLTSTVEDVVSGKRKPLSGSETITLLNNLNSIMEHPELKGFRPGELNTKILEPLGPEYFISGRCIALLEALREYGGALCHADKSIKALVWQMDEDTFRNPQPVKPAQDGNKVLPLLAKKHLDKLSEEKNNHMYMATRDSILVLVPGFEEKAAEAVRRLEEKLEKDGKIYATPNKAGYVCIPQYRSGYIRRLPDSDVMVQVRATIANVWVLPNTAQRYIKGLKEWMEKNGIENHAESTTANAADLTRMILMSPGNASVDERLALLQKAAKELLIEKEKHKSTKVSANDSKNTRTL